MKYERVVRHQLRAEVLPWIALALISVAAALFLPINQDTVWQVWVGRQMLGGAELYTDILEVNPPLLFWISAIQAAIGEIVGSRAAVVIFCFGLVGISLWLTPARFRLPALAAVAILPMADFSKAEHLTLITTIPYAFLIAARMEGGEVRRPWATGFLAALGFAMKPYFILVPLALECLAWQQRRVRPETSALAISAVAYGAAVILFTPAYLTDVVPMVRAAYGAFAGRNQFSIPLFFALLLAAGGMAGRRGSPTAVTLAVAAFAFLPAVYIQGKGWPYQSIPVRGFLFLAVVAWIMSARRRPFQDALLVAAGALCFYPFGPYRNPNQTETERHLAAVQRGSSIAVLSGNPALAWPMVEERGLRWQLTTICMWQLPASRTNQTVKADMEARLARDLATKPDIIVIDSRGGVNSLIKASLPTDYLSGYTLWLQTGHMESYVKSGLGDAIDPDRSRSDVPA